MAAVLRSRKQLQTDVADARDEILRIFDSVRSRASAQQAQSALRSFDRASSDPHAHPHTHTHAHARSKVRPSARVRRQTRELQIGAAEGAIMRARKDGCAAHPHLGHCCRRSPQWIHS